MSNTYTFVAMLLVTNYANFMYPMQAAVIEQPLVTSIAGVVIGVDVGGTNTDAVLLDQGRLVARIKRPTTEDITTGIVQAITGLFEKNEPLKAQVTGINIGTTHLLNALLQRRGLDKPLVLRLAAPATTAVPPAIGWDEQIKKELLNDDIYTIGGGFEFNGTPISALDREALFELARYIKAKHIKSVAVTAVFSNLSRSQEEEVRTIFKRHNPELEVSMSHMMGGLGLLERENATILNACLASQNAVMKHALYKALKQLAIKAPLFITYGDGTKDRLDDASAIPLRTLKSGPINSLKGAALLTNYMNGIASGSTQEIIDDAVIVDIGGNTSDEVMLISGAPVKENSAYTIEGIRCNFSSARFHSFGLGGGSIITIDALNRIKIGPESVGKDLVAKALVYGGSTLTPTDIACALGRLKLGTVDLVTLKKRIAACTGESVDTFIDRVDNAMHVKLVEGIRYLTDSLEKVPKTLLLVGGGACLFDRVYLKSLLNNRFERIIIPPLADIANALGAAASLISGTSVGIYDFARQTSQEAIREATDLAIATALKKGALSEGIKTVDERTYSLNYLQGDPKQVTVTVAGPDGGKHSHSSLSEASESTLHDTIEPALLPQYEQLVHIKKKQSEMEEYIRQARAGRKPLPGIKLLTPLDINDISRGAGILGSGGGGNPEMGRLMALNAIKRGYAIQMISSEDLPDDAFVVDFGGVGSPEVSSERPSSIIEGVQVIHLMEKRSGKKVTALLLGEAAGSNATEPLLVAAILDIPVIDCDCMGRAFPQIDMTTPHIYGTFTEFYAAVSNGVKKALIEAENFADLEEKVRVATVEMGGAVSCAMSAMSGAQVKKWTIKGTLSVAQAIGRSLREAHRQPFTASLKVLNEVLAQTDYKEAHVVFEGRIINLTKGISNGFSIGGFTVINTAQTKVDVGFQNENLIAQDHGTKKVLALVPELITIVDKNNFQPICCEDLRYGQEVVILKMSPPAMMNTEKARKIVGPQAFQIDGILGLLTERNNLRSLK